MAREHRQNAIQCLSVFKRVVVVVCTLKQLKFNIHAFHLPKIEKNSHKMYNAED